MRRRKIGREWRWFADLVGMCAGSTVAVEKSVTDVKTNVKPGEMRNLVAWAGGDDSLVTPPPQETGVGVWGVRRGQGSS